MKYILGIIFITFFSLVYAQGEKREKFPSYFGLQVRPLFPTRFIGSPELTLTNANYTTTLSQKTGYTFGGTVRAGITKLIAIETGLNFVQRNFAVSMSVPDSNVYAVNSLEFINYDIPLNGLVYIQLSEKWFMNTSLGGSMQFKPTHIEKVTLPFGSHKFTHVGFVKPRTAFALNANVGFEFRTDKSGFFYVGGSAQVPLNSIFVLYTQYKYQGVENNIHGDVDGSFLAFDIKYFFPNIKNKGTQFKNGPIEQ